MKLKVNSFKNKKGEMKTSIALKKLDATGTGISIEDKVRFKLAFEPYINTLMNRKEGKQFKTITVYAVPLNHLDFFTSYMDKDYKTVTLHLPNTRQILEVMEKATVDNEFEIGVKQYKDKDGKDNLGYTIRQLDVVSQYEEKEEPNYIQTELDDEELPF